MCCEILPGDKRDLEVFSYLSPNLGRVRARIDRGRRHFGRLRAKLGQHGPKMVGCVRGGGGVELKETRSIMGGSPVAGPNFDQPDLGPKMGAQDRDLGNAPFSGADLGRGADSRGPDMIRRDLEIRPRGQSFERLFSGHHPADRTLGLVMDDLRIGEPRAA